MIDHRLLEEVRSSRRELFNDTRLRAELEQQGFDGIIAVSPINITYSGGALFKVPYVLSFVVTLPDGRQGVVVNEADAYYFAKDSWIKDVRSYRYSTSLHEMNEAAIGLLQGLMADLGIERGNFGIERNYLPAFWCEAIEQAFPNIKFVDCAAAFQAVRMFKTPREIDVLRIAAYYTDKAIGTSFALARPGDTEKSIADRIYSTMLSQGADYISHCVASTGLQSTIVHAWPSALTLKPGEVVHVDTGGDFAGYQTDLARNAVVGRPSPQQADIYARMWDAHQKICERLQPGVHAGELYSFARKCMTDVGLDHPWGTFGHSTGLSVHEGFEIAEGSNQIIQPGMAINIEPSHIEAGDARYHLEDTFAIHEDHAELLSSFTDRSEMLCIQ
jgi:Xaa-Pro aminopeptidase/Xaa-Pro dipeptidase